ncbi:MAG: DUF1553 domain-containing protein [Cyclobacteriaceae bacterium]
MTRIKVLNRFSLILAIGAVFAGCNSNHDSITEGEKIDFNYDVRPILSDRCFACHGPDANTRKAGLRLDTESGAMALLGENQDHYAIVPGKPSKSSLVDRIFSDDPDMMMPPGESNLSLTASEKEVLKKWIEQGAEWKPHWAFIKPEKGEVPHGISPVDYYIKKQLKKVDLSPSESADKEVLIRRIAFDLTGLPPSLNEVEGFRQDQSENAVERVLDQMLDKSSYGERMAVEWLDLARYADSHGYQDDGMRNMWPWRNWVIDAFNNNMPFDDFVVWQMAGDLLDNPTDEQLLATGFNRNHMQSQEGGIVSEEYRVEYVADRTNTLGQGFLGLSLECARCHDHKYDPVTQKEYFEFFAFFNSVNETGQIPYAGEASPTLILKDSLSEIELNKLKGGIERLLKDQAQFDALAFQKWKEASILKKATPNVHFSLDELLETKDHQFALVDSKEPKRHAWLAGHEEDLPLHVDTKFGRGFDLTGDSYISAGKSVAAFERNDPFSVSVWIKNKHEGNMGPIFTRSGGLFDGNRGYECMLNSDGTLTASLNHVFPANSISVTSEEAIPVDEWVMLTMTYDGSSKATGINLYINDERLSLNIFEDNLHRSIRWYGKDSVNWYWNMDFAVGKRFEETLDEALIDDIKIFNDELTAVEVKQLFDPMLDEFNEAELQEYYVKRVCKSCQQKEDSAQLLIGRENKLLTDLEEVMIMRELREPRPTYVLARGQYDAPTEPVVPNVPDYILSFKEDWPNNRLGLAYWLTDHDNPLVARVMVNRLWQMLFGQGLVSTSNDFGSQGELPSHPQLLDWLAVEFVASGWDIKHMLKLIMLSDTYQQDSKSDDRRNEIDPYNVWLSRGPSHRLPAEMIRDHALSASGLLVSKIGGPSVYPYQPQGLWKQLATRNATEYHQGVGDDLYRRSIYTVWKRTSPPPSMMNFDTPERSFCTVKRQKTSTPLQALELMNDPQFVEASRKLAERVMMTHQELNERISLGFKLLTGRMPSTREMNLLSDLYRDEYSYLGSADREVEDWLAIGASSYDESLDKHELATTTLVMSTILNYDETVFKR